MRDLRELLPEEEEYQRAMVEASRPRDLVLQDEALRLMALAMGTALTLGVLLAVLISGYLLTGWRSLLWANLLVAGMAIASFAYLLYARSRLTLRL